MARWTPEHDDELRRRNAAGDSLTRIAKDLGFSPGTVSRKAAALGLSWDTAKIAAATAGRRDRLKATRADIVERLYGRALHTLERLEAETFTTLVKGSYGVERQDELPFVPPHDLKALVQSVGTVITSAVRLEQVDADTGTDGSQVDAWLDHVAGGPLDSTDRPEAKP